MNVEMTGVVNVFLLYFALFCLINHAVAQPPDTLWTKTFGGINEDIGYSVQETFDGGYIITGYTHSFGAGGDDVWLIKTDSNGDSLWTKTFGGSDEEYGSSVHQSTDGGYIITGTTNSFGHGAFDVWLIKTNLSGDTIWTNTFGGNFIDWGSSVQQTSDGGYIIAGNMYDRYDDVYLVKTDVNGNLLWSKTFGGGSYDFGNSVQQTSDGGYIVTGSTGSFGSGLRDAWLLKADANGDTIWTKTYGGNDYEEGNSVQETLDGGYIITGRTSSFGAGSFDLWLIKTDVTGDTMWAKTFGGNSWDSGFSVQQTSDGGYIIAGTTGGGSGGIGGGLWLIRTNVDGDTLWTKNFGGSGSGRSVQQTSNGGYIVAGSTSLYGAGFSDVWLISVAPEVNSIDGAPQVPFSDYRLEQNYPNPFNPTTSIQYAISSKQYVSLKVFDLIGKEIATLVKEEKPVGEYTVEFDASKLSSGIYFYQLQAGDFTETKKMILIR